ncbi:MAG: peroxidase [Ramlibacter sp.]|nr:peroxidase [Ramlibacter sp.]
MAGRRACFAGRQLPDSHWVNDGDFVSEGLRSDPIVGRRDLADDYVYPARPVRRHLTGLPDFTVTRGGEHVFFPGFSGPRWLAQLTAPEPPA